MFHIVFGGFYFLPDFSSLDYCILDNYLRMGQPSKPALLNALHVSECSILIPHVFFFICCFFYLEGYLFPCLTHGFSVNLQRFSSCSHLSPGPFFGPVPSFSKTKVSSKMYCLVGVHVNISLITLVCIEPLHNIILFHHGLHMPVHAFNKY